MRYRVEVSSTAEEELGEVRGYLAEHAPDYLRVWLTNMRRAVLSLQDMPQRCPPAPESELFEMELRQLLESSYRILFTISGQTVRILHIRHSARAPVGPDDD